MKPYVERFQRDTDSISDLISKFSLTALKTNMETILQGGEEGAKPTISSCTNDGSISVTT